VKTIHFSSLVLVALSVARCGSGKPSSMSTTGASGSGGVAVSGNGGSAGVGSTGAAGGISATSPEATRLTFMPVGISGDGSVVVGRDFHDPTHPFRWTEATGTEPLAGLTDFQVVGISTDGMTVVGDTIASTGRSQAGRFAGGTRTDIDLPRSTDTESHVIAVCRDGTAITGNAWSANPAAYSSQAFRWSAAGGVVGLGFLPGDGASEAFAMSPDGETVVGLSYDLSRRKGRPFRWTKAGGMQELATLAGSSFTSPVAVNDAGTAIGDSFVGGDVSINTVSAATARRPIVWMQGPPTQLSGCPSTMWAAASVAGDGTVLAWCPPTNLLLASPGASARLLALPPPPAGFGAADQSVFPRGLSGDGTVVVGRYDLGSLGGTANILAVWKGGGTQPSLLAQKLTGTPGAVELPNPNAFALSDDGSTLVGVADGPAGWVLRLH